MEGWVVNGMMRKEALVYVFSRPGHPRSLVDGFRGIPRVRLADKGVSCAPLSCTS